MLSVLYVTKKKYSILNKINILNICYSYIFHLLNICRIHFQDNFHMDIDIPGS